MLPFVCTYGHQQCEGFGHAFVYTYSSSTKGLCIHYTNLTHIRYTLQVYKKGPIFKTDDDDDDDDGSSVLWSSIVQKGEMWLSKQRRSKVLELALATLHIAISTYCM